MHRHLSITIDTRRGAQHWQRAALVMSIISGISLGLFFYILLFNRLSVPVATEEHAIGISLHPAHQNTELAQKMLGYAKTSSGETLSHTPSAPFLLDFVTRTTLPTDTDQSVSLFSLTPTSYLSYKGTVVPFRAQSEGIILLSKTPAKTASQHISPGFSYLNIAPSMLPSSLFESPISHIAFNQAEKTLSLTGNGEEGDIINLVSLMNRPLVTEEFHLEDGTRVREIRATSPVITIETTGPVTTYASTQPFFLATHNKHQNIWSLRNFSALSGLDSDPQETILCPPGSIGVIQNPVHIFRSQGEFVRTIVDKLTISRKRINLCITVDNL